MLEDDFLHNEIAVSVAQIIASANRQAKELGFNVKKSLITVSQHFANDV